MMIKVHSIPERIHCPFCGQESLHDHCSHLVAIFTEGGFEGNGCQHLNPDIREKYFNYLNDGFPGTMEEAAMLKYHSKAFVQFRKANDTVTLAFTEHESRLYEKPIIRIVFREI